MHQQCLSKTDYQKKKFTHDKISKSATMFRKQFYPLSKHILHVHIHISVCARCICHTKARNKFEKTTTKHTVITIHSQVMQCALCKIVTVLILYWSKLNFSHHLPSSSWHDQYLCSFFISISYRVHMQGVGDVTCTWRI